MRPRTQNDFDSWFKDHGDDPWGYSSPVVKERLKDSLSFIRQNNPYDFFVEFGSFNGDFTKLLSNVFPSSRIWCIEISAVAIEDARRKCWSVDFVNSDMLDYIKNMPPQTGRPITVLLLECLYYLAQSEREEFIKELAKKLTVASQVFISAPISGGDYLLEPWLIENFKKYNFKLRTLKVLNLRNLGRLANRFTASTIKIILFYSSFFRKRCANQVVYLFEK